jgi:DNA-binding MarR family transcriptional regulator
MQALLELTSQNALFLWFAAIADSVRRKRADLSARQMAILLSIYMEAPPHTVRGMAAALGISKPAVTRALDTLAKHGFVRRAPDPADGRSILAQRTVKGSVFLSEFGDIVAGAAHDIEAPLSPPQ